MSYLLLKEMNHAKEARRIIWSHEYENKKKMIAYISQDIFQTTNIFFEKMESTLLTRSEWKEVREDAEW